MYVINFVQIRKKKKTRSVSGTSILFDDMIIKWIVMFDEYHHVGELVEMRENWLDTELPKNNLFNFG